MERLKKLNKFEQKEKKSETKRRQMEAEIKDHNQQIFRTV